jgi:hypothetical protein
VAKKKPTPEIESAIASIRDERVIFREVFTKAYGPQVLAWLGNESGAWSMDPEKKDGKHLPANPYTIALFNRLLAKIGILHPQNLETVAVSLLEASNDDDLAMMRRQDIVRKKEEESE